MNKTVLNHRGFRFLPMHRADAAVSHHQRCSGVHHKS